jgi:hypothetical protein
MLWSLNLLPSLISRINILIWRHIDIFMQLLHPGLTLFLLLPHVINLMIRLHHIGLWILSPWLFWLCLVSFIFEWILWKLISSTVRIIKELFCQVFAWPIATFSLLIGSPSLGCTLSRLLRNNYPAIATASRPQIVSFLLHIHIILTLFNYHSIIYW